MATTGQSKYILGERIAQGGMAEIYLGKIVGAEGFTRICAIKKILPHFAEDSDFIQMFKNEAMLAKQLQNRNIVQVYDFVSEPGETPMLVMEYIDGQDLRAILRESEKSKIKIPVELAVYFAAEILTGLAYAHSSVDVVGKSLGIIHRDISPQNILVSFEGDVKITDFGIAKVQSAASVTKAGVLKGKFRYMSPEQATGQKIDSRSDVFAAGVVLYEMLTMTRLFKGDDDFQILQAVRECKVRSPNDIKGINIPTELESIVLKLLQKEVQTRFQTAKDAAKELTRFLYSFRKDFFPGELSDFMQKIFSSRIEDSREKIRTTLALPIESSRPNAHFDINNKFNSSIEANKQTNSDNNSQKPDWQQGEAEAAQQPHQTNLSKTNGDFKDQIVLDSNAMAKQEPKNSGTNAKHSLTSPPKNADSSINIGTNYRKSARIQSPTRFAYKVKPKPKGVPWSKVFFGLIATILVAIIGFAYVLKQKIVKFPSTLEIKAQMPSQKKVRIKIDGVAYNNNKLVELPVQLSLDTGQHIIIISKPGFMEHRINFSAPLLGLSYFGGTKSETVLLRQGETALSNLLIITEPKKNAKVTLDEEFSGTSGKAIEFVPVGRRYHLKIEHSQCTTFIGELEIPMASANRLFSKQITLSNCEK